MPAYNAEKTIEKAIRSIMEQTYKDLQILIIDDGSNDRTLEIIRVLAQEDPRIEYYHKENGGIGSAYIYAFSRIAGGYCLFVDSDDYVSVHLANDVMSVIEKTEADIVQFGITKYDENGKRLGSLCFPKKEIIGTEAILKDYFYGLSSGSNFPGLSTRAVRSSFFKDFDYYSSSLSIDEVLAVHVSSKAEKLVCLDKEYYCLIAYKTSVSRASVTCKKVVGQFNGLSLIPKIVACFDKEIQTLAAIRLLSFAANFYNLFIEGYGKKKGRIIIKELYKIYCANRQLVKVPIKTRVTFSAVRYMPFLNVMKNKISKI